VNPDVYLTKIAVHELEWQKVLREFSVRLAQILELRRVASTWLSAHSCNYGIFIR